MLCGMDLAAVKDLAHIAPVSEQVDESALTVGTASPLLAIGQGLKSSPDSEPVHFLKQKSDRTKLQISPEHPPDLLSFLRHDDQLLLPVDVAQGGTATHEEAFCL